MALGKPGAYSFADFYSYVRIVFVNKYWITFKNVAKFLLRGEGMSLV